MLVSGRVFMDIYFCRFHSAVPLFNMCNGDPRRMERLQADMQLRPKMYLDYNKNQMYPKCVCVVVWKLNVWFHDKADQMSGLVFVVHVFFPLHELSLIGVQQTANDMKWIWNGALDMQNDFERFVLLCWRVLQACHDVCFLWCLTFIRSKRG